MAGNTPNNVRTQRMIRLFLQQGGASPNNPLSLEGVGYGYSAIKGVTRNIRGGVSNIAVRRPDGSGFQNVGSMESNPGYDEAELDIMETIAGIPLASVLETCPVALYEVRGYDCDQLSDHLQGYAQGYVRVYQDSVIDTGIDYGDGMAYTDDNAVEAKIKLKVRGGIFDHGQIYANQLATASATDLTTTLTTDVVYGNAQQCANCGQPNDGTYLKYWSAASTTASPGGKPVVFYQLGSQTPVPVSVTSAGVAENLTGIAMVGSNLVVISSTAGGAGIGGYHFAPIGTNGVPGAWTKVVTGFQANKEPTDILALSASEVYFAANGGYIYKSTNLASGVSVINAGATTTANLLRIQGNRSLIVAVGATGAIIISNNSGVSWSAPVATPAAGTPSYQAVDVIGAKTIWVGSATGRLFQTVDGGNTWTEFVFSGSSAGAVTDIYFVNASEGYFLHNTATPTGRIFRTYNGGASWWNTSPAIEGLGTFTSLGRLAAPTVGNETLKANNIAVSGTVTGTQGLLLTFAPQVF
jgi:hypothetical protein